MHLRNSVLWFAQKMEAKLRENDHKPYWRDQTQSYLLGYLEGELRELRKELYRDELDRDKVISEAVDVGNMAMMIADNMGRVLRPESKGR